VPSRTFHASSALAGLAVPGRFGREGDEAGVTIEERTRSEAFSGEALARELGKRLRGLASISDQSGGRTVLRVSGPYARAVLAKGLPIDLHPRAFETGSAATSTISLMGVQIWQVDDAPAYDLAIFRSVSASFWHWLTASAGEFGYTVAKGGSRPQ
jgi:methylglutamate dehydrogenase subunit D